MEPRMDEGQSSSSSYAYNRLGQTCLRSRDQLSRVKHRIKRSHIFVGAPQAPAAAEAITSRALAEPSAAAAEVAAAPAPAPAKPLGAPPQQCSHSACSHACSSAACTVSSSDSTSKGPRSSEECRQHKRQTPLHVLLAPPP